MFCFSLSYLQLENFALPPIGTTAVHRPTKLSSLNSIAQQQQQQPEQPQTVSSTKAINDAKTTPSTAGTAVATTKPIATATAATAASQRHAEPNTMSNNNTTDLRVQNGNESKCKLN